MSLTKGEARTADYNTIESRYWQGMYTTAEYEAYCLIWRLGAKRYGEYTTLPPLFDDVREVCENWGFEVVCDDNAIPVALNDLG